jgi:hypothetical protein
MAAASCQAPLLSINAESPFTKSVSIKTENLFSIIACRGVHYANNRAGVAVARVFRRDADL